MEIINILDIDLDFFLDNRFTSKPQDRLDSNEYHPWKPYEVVNYLEQNCKLDKNKKISGKYFTYHDEVFYFLRDLQYQENYKLLFSIDHLDAHADLGLGDTSFMYIITELMYQPLRCRFNPKVNYPGGLSEGNFLAFAIACRWVKDITYVNKKGDLNDFPYYLFKDFDIETNKIELIARSRQFMDACIFSHTNLPPISSNGVKEPIVPFLRVDYDSFVSYKKYDYIFLTQSPEYTPKTSDALIPIIEDYFNKI